MKRAYSKAPLYTTNRKMLDSAYLLCTSYPFVDKLFLSHYPLLGPDIAPTLAAFKPQSEKSDGSFKHAGIIMSSLFLHREHLLEQFLKTSSIISSPAFVQSCISLDVPTEQRSGDKSTFCVRQFVPAG